MKTIKDLPEYSRPREKLRNQGTAALTDEELVDAILGMDTPDGIREMEQFLAPAGSK